MLEYDFGPRTYNPSSLNIDVHQISPNIFTARADTKVVRVTEVIT